MKNTMKKVFNNLFAYLQAKTKTVVATLQENSGQMVTENAGWTIFAIVVVGLVITLVVAAIQNDFMPLLIDRVKDLFN